MVEYSRPTISDVAERAGVSIATVSRVINKTGLVAEATVARVESVIHELNFTPHAAARVLARRKTNTIGLILYDISGEFFQPMLRGIEAGTWEHGYDLLIHCTHRLPDPTTSRSYPLGEHNADGVVIYGSSMTDDEITRLGHVQFPLVLLHRSSPPDVNIPSVNVENKAGARKLVDYLIEQRGHRRIAFLAGPANEEDSHWREVGYRQSLASHDLSFDPALIGRGEFNEAVSRETVLDWLRAGLHMDVIFAADDASAMGAMAAVRELGRRIPDDIAVVGFDDISVAAHLTPPLTTVRAPTEMAAREAVNQLVRLIRTGEADPVTLLPTELVIRRSCGHP
jgi:LacI family transcriptional regulator